MRRMRVLAWAAILAALPPASAGAQGNPPRPVELLFERQHLSALETGAEVVYRFERTIAQPKAPEDRFADEIRLVVTAVSPAGTRELALSVFSGEQQLRHTVPEMTGNPVLVLFLDRAVNNMTRLTGGSRAYFKSRMRAGLLEKAVIEPVAVSYQGKSAEAFRVSVLPFQGDPNAAGMLGYDGAKFTFVVSEAVPGHLVDLTASFESAMPGAPRLGEHIALVGAGAVP
jgi:hypothetical protein